MIEELSDFKYIKYDKLYIYDLLDKGNAEVFKGKYKDDEIAIKKYEYSDLHIETLSKDLDEIFDISRYYKHVDTVFTRIFG